MKLRDKKIILFLEGLFVISIFTGFIFGGGLGAILIGFLLILHVRNLEFLLYSFMWRRRKGQYGEAFIQIIQAILEDEALVEDMVAAIDPVSGIGVESLWVSSTSSVGADNDALNKIIELPRINQIIKNETLRYPDGLLNESVILHHLEILLWAGWNHKRYGKKRYKRVLPHIEALVRKLKVGIKQSLRESSSLLTRESLGRRFAVSFYKKYVYNLFKRGWLGFHFSVFIWVSFFALGGLLTLCMFLAGQTYEGPKGLEVFFLFGPFLFILNWVLVKQFLFQLQPNLKSIEAWLQDINNVDESAPVSINDFQSESYGISNVSDSSISNSEFEMNQSLIQQILRISKRWIFIFGFFFLIISIGIISYFDWWYFTLIIPVWLTPFGFLLFDRLLMLKYFLRTRPWGF